MIDKIGGIYAITNTVTGDFYIGSACNLYKRFGEHRRSLIGNYHRNAHLQNAWNKYGADHFTFEVVLYCDKSMTLFYEQALLDGLKPTYNIAKDVSAPMLGLKASEETKQRMSQVRMGENNQNFGKHFLLSDETKRKMSEAKKGCSFTDEHKQRLSEAQLGELNHMFGKHHTPETRAKMSEAHLNRRQGIVLDVQIRAKSI